MTIFKSKFNSKKTGLVFLGLVMMFVVAFIMSLLTTLPEARAQDTAPTTKTHTFINPIFLQLSLQTNNKFIGKYLTVYYGYGSPGSLRNQDDQITLREVRERRTYKIESNTVKIDQMALKKVPINIAYSIIVFVIHDGPNFTWLNGDRTINNGLPKGETVTSSSTLLDADYLSVVEVDALKEEQNADSKEIALKYLYGSHAY